MKESTKQQIPKVRPIKPDIEDAEMTQSRYPTLPRLPVRALLVGPSASGKTQTSIWALIEGFKGLFDRVFIFCKTADCDSAWAPLIPHIRNEMKVPPSERVLWTDEDGEAVRER